MGKAVKLTKDSHQEVLQLFGDDLIHYHFLIDDLVRNNYEGESFQVFGEYENERLVSILLNNFNNVTYYSPSDRNVVVYTEILKRLTFSKLSGPSQLMRNFLPYVKLKKETLSYLGVVRGLTAKRKYPDLPIKMITNEREIGMQYDLLLSTSEFIDSIPKSRDEYILNESKRLMGGTARTAYLSLEHEMVSSCSTAKEDKNSAIIIGVATNPKFQNRGYGTEVLIGLFEMLLKEGKYPYLFYNNPAARSVYRNIGATEVCEWSVIHAE